MQYREEEFTGRMKQELQQCYCDARSRLYSEIQDGEGKEIFHYTSAEGFYNIIRNKQFFLTDVAFLNDSTEMANIITVFQATIKALEPSLEKSFSHCLIDLLERDDFDYLFFGSEEADSQRYFVLACSYEQDSLNLWNYYTKDNENDGGYNITFDRKELVDSFEMCNRAFYSGDMNLSSGRIIYDEKTKVHIISSFLLELNTAWKMAQAHDEQKEGREENQKHLLLGAIKAAIRWLSIFFKHECFAMEREYRIILALPNSRLTKYCSCREPGVERLYKIRFTNNMFTPYVKLAFQPSGVKGVCMSPLCEKYVTEYRLREELTNTENGMEMRDVLQYGVHEFLRIHGYDLKYAQIKRSEIPLRF